MPSVPKPKLNPMPIPINAKTKTMITKTITAMTAITNALIQPQSKKCLISASQTMNMIIEAMMPPINQSTTEPMTMPKTTIQMASVNFAFCLPASALPTSQSTGATTMMATTICIKSPIIVQN